MHWITAFIVAFKSEWGDGPGVFEDWLAGCSVLEASGEYAPEVISRLRVEGTIRLGRCSAAWPIQGGVFVYVIADPGHGLKVGVSDNPEGRLSALQIGNPRPLVMGYRSRPFTRRDAFAVEMASHEILRPHLLRGEWFGCGLDVAIRAVKRSMVVGL